jgi:exosortase/archaeosortase family protein
MSAGAFPGSQPRARHRAERGPTRRRDPSTARPPASRMAKLITTVGLLTLAGIMPTQDMRMRDLEAWLASHVIALCGVQTGYAGGSSAVAWFAEATNLRISLAVTPECTIALLTIPFLVATAGLAWRTPVRRCLAGLAIAIVLLEVLNQLRLLTIASMLLTAGYPGGYYWGHTILGSVLLIFGLTAILGLFATVTLRRGRGGTGSTR